MGTTEVLTPSSSSLIATFYHLLFLQYESFCVKQNFIYFHNEILKKRLERTLPALLLYDMVLADLVETQKSYCML